MASTMNTDPLKDTLSISKNLTGRILHSMNEGILVLDRSDHIEFANNALAGFLGFPNGNELLGKHIREIDIHPDGADHIISSIDTGSSHSWENTFTGREGKKITGLFSMSAIMNESGDVDARVISIQDITERKKTEGQVAAYASRLENTNKELDQFAYIVSHDLKAPLRAISNLSLWIMEDLGTTVSEESAKNLAMLRGRVSRMESLINGILEYSKIGKLRVASEVVDISVLLSDVADLLAPPAHIILQIDEDMPVIVGPKTMLHQVFSNLIGNAIKYNDKPEGIVRVSSQDENDRYVFTVEDNGPGIAPEYHEKVFQIFQTLQSRDKFESTGIGLTIVKRIIEDQGGKIWLDSTPGKGSRFIFSWPATTGNP